MRAKSFFIHTTKELPAEAETKSHQLMLRGGLIRRAASGIYTWLPLGWRIVQKVANIVRANMNAAGAAEVLMPAVQPADLWHESGRWKDYGAELLRLQDRHQRDFCIGPTHEEVVTDIVRSTIASYRQLPINLYQIQTKFRDEIRPRFGVMRAREFVMKDAYSFDTDRDGMEKSYEIMRQAYCNIFDKISLNYRMVEADAGTIGGNFSHEFMVLAETGEELILHSDSSDFAANVERCPVLPPTATRPPPTQALQKIHTPDVKTIAALQAFLGDAIANCVNVKTMIVRGDNGTVAVLLKGQHQLNMVKAGHHPAIGKNPYLLGATEAQAIIGAGFGSLGPVDMPLPVIADNALRDAADFVCGANVDDYHYVGVNFERDCPLPDFADVRNAEIGDPSPCGNGTLLGVRGIEVGHIFQLGDKYSAAMKASIKLPEGESTNILMGCYGIGVTRIVAAAIEQSNDEAGMKFPDAIAPFNVVIAPIGWGKSADVQQAASTLYQKCLSANIDVLLDDRDLRPGVMFADLDLIGIPHRIVVGERGLQNSEVEYKNRLTGQTCTVAIDDTIDFLTKQINN